MSEPASTFIDQCVSGDVVMDQIDDFIDVWHETPGVPEIHEFLGMTKMEYSLWVADPDVLPYIVTAHRDKVPIESLLEQPLPMAARAASAKKAVALTKWLKANGELK